MAYFGRQPKKPQQLGRVVGGRTRPGTPSKADAIRVARAVRRSIEEERPGRPPRAVRTLRATRAARSERSAR